MDAKKFFQEFLKQYAEQVKDYYEERQRKYVDLSNEMTELAPYIETMSNKILNLSIDDQIVVMKKVVELGNLEKKMCEKYNINIYEDSDYEEE